MNGEWIEAPGEALFQVLNQKLGKLPVLAEDLRDYARGRSAAGPI